MKLKDTLQLPRTAFPMKASLPQREPERLLRWDREDLHGRLREAGRGRPKYVLHDGPPYANGHVHLGTALNKILKDFVLKSRMQAGFDVPYVPGWDQHGMPIEHQVLKEARKAGEDLSVREIRSRCREFADRFVGIQREEFRRLGILGLWSDPYLTTDPAYEATIVAAFGTLHAKGFIHRGLRSIHWCPTCRTALANAEVEHDPKHRSTAITVRFPVPAAQTQRLGLPPGLALLAWTTTPWTLPANVALAVHPDLEYVVLAAPGGPVMVARALRDRVLAEVGWTGVEELASRTGREIEGLRARHPWEPRDAPVVTAEHVTTDAGTGIVHTAPGHGVEDFETGRRHGLPVLVPVDRGGVYTAEAGRYAGQHVFAANDRIVQDLRSSGALVHAGEVVHSYPTCWRCREPLIFLATEQWFLRVDHEDLRSRCLREVDRAEWIPSWGHDRMRDSVASRPDWCLSRQRAWGVPVPALACADCGETVLTPAVVEAIRGLVASRGSDAWFELAASEIAPPGTTCGGCGGSRLEKDPNILDVWFDSACSHAAVLDSGRWPELSWPADLYLEAVDQHRGWFQVSLLESVATRGSAPFRAVLTHGLILDEQGRKMSKSLGNVVSPEEILGSHGADVLRLFFASVDATADVKFSKSLLEPVSEAYRKIRNTLRFLLGNLHDYDPVRDAIPEERMADVDRYALARLRQVTAEVRQAWRELAFHRVHRLLLGYLTTDVSAFQAHVLKDRLYCELPSGPERRSAQAALFAIARETCQLLAPITCFTADEVWENLPSWEGKPASVHLATWPESPEPDQALLATWQRRLALRDDVLKALEVARAAGRIGDPLEADVILGPGLHAADVEGHADTMAEICVVSHLEVGAAGGAAPAGAMASESVEGAWVLVTPAAGRRCPRCWRWRRDFGSLPAQPDACGRCARVLGRMGVEIDAA